MSRNKNDRAVKAWTKWTIIKGCLNNTEALYEFAAFLGDPKVDDRRYIVNIENQEVMRKIDLINGPNGHTLLKMWIAQNE